MHSWDEIISKEEHLVYEKAGYGRRSGPGKKPALVIIDVTKGFIGDKPEPILESIKRFPNSCGETGWNAMLRIKELLPVARRARIPVIYSANDSDDFFATKAWTRKSGRTKERGHLYFSSARGLTGPIAPKPGDVIVRKSKPSLFFGTSFASTLVALGVDTLLVTGCTTSGCVRATVIDAFSYNLRVLVVEECTFDRACAPHLVNLFDMNEKYADVVTLAETKRYIVSHPRPSARKKLTSF